MTVELFYTDPYQREFTAQVTRRDGVWLTLDQSCFWPGDDSTSNCDTGHMAGHQVCEVRRNESSDLVHRIQLTAGRERPRPGQYVTCTIDWEQRYRMMRTHTAQHLIDLGLRATHDLAGAVFLVGAGGVHQLSIVLASGEFEHQTILNWVAAVVSDDLPIRVQRDPSRGGRRLLHLDGHGHRPCDGLHVGSTGEVGAVNLCKAGEHGIRLDLSVEVAEGVKGWPTIQW